MHDPELAHRIRAHLPVWILALILIIHLVRLPELLLFTVRGVVGALAVPAAILLGLVGTQIYIGRGSGFLVRLAWMAMAACGVWLTIDLYPYFREALPHDMGMKHNGGLLARYDPAQPAAWWPVGMMGYYLLAAFIWVPAAFLVINCLRYWRQDALRGATAALAAETEPAFLLRFWQRLFGTRQRSAGAWSPPMSGGGNEPPLATRDTAALRPQLTFASLWGNQALKDKLLAAAREWDNGGQKNGKNGIFLYGEPGTGKTAFAEALAGELKLRIIKANVGSIASRWINQTTEQLNDLLESALHQAPCVLFLDEIDSVFPDRTQMNTSNAEEAKVIGTFLSAVEKIRRGRVLLIAATNYRDRVDPAAIREGRFDFHIEVPLPDQEARKGLILAALQKAGRSVDPGVLERLARRWAGFNVPRILEATGRAARIAANERVRMREFMRALRDVQGNRAGPPESAPEFRDLYFDDEVKERLEELAATFAHVDEVELRGGTVPKGIIFYGPPGTGKTSMAMALAKAAGWTFISTSGKEIASDWERLRDIRRRASDLRPAIVFIDEADDILGDRSFSGLKLHTNDLLRIIDGAGEPLPDVCWILATNHLDALDPAVFRRFPVKIRLDLPSGETLRRFIQAWAERHARKLDAPPEEWAARVADALQGLAPSVVENILETALNSEAARSVLRDTPMSLSLDDILKARKEMAL